MIIMNILVILTILEESDEVFHTSKKSLKKMYSEKIFTRIFFHPTFFFALKFKRWEEAFSYKKQYKVTQNMLCYCKYLFLNYSYLFLHLLFHITYSVIFHFFSHFIFCYNSYFVTLFYYKYFFKFNLDYLGQWSSW